MLLRWIDRYSTPLAAHILALSVGCCAFMTGCAKEGEYHSPLSIIATKETDIPFTKNVRYAVVDDSSILLLYHDSKDTLTIERYSSELGYRGSYSVDIRKAFGFSSSMQLIEEVKNHDGMLDCLYYEGIACFAVAGDKVTPRRFVRLKYPYTTFARASNSFLLFRGYNAEFDGMVCEYSKVDTNGLIQVRKGINVPSIPFTHWQPCVISMFLDSSCYVIDPLDGSLQVIRSDGTIDSTYDRVVHWDGKYPKERIHRFVEQASKDNARNAIQLALDMMNEDGSIVMRISAFGNDKIIVTRTAYSKELKKQREVSFTFFDAHRDGKFNPVLTYTSPAKNSDQEVSLHKPVVVSFRNSIARVNDSTMLVVSEIPHDMMKNQKQSSDKAYSNALREYQNGRKMTYSMFLYRIQWNG